MIAHRVQQHKGMVGGRLIVHWYAVYSKPRQEYAVRACLRSQGVEVYLPVLRSSGKKRLQERAEKPFFARYLFARMDLSAVPLSSVKWMPGVTRMVSFGGQPAIVPDEIVEWLKDRLARVDLQDYHEGLPLRPGDRLRVTTGPLQDMEVIYDRRLSSQGRALVLVEMLGRLSRCEIGLDCLRHA